MWMESLVTAKSQRRRLVAMVSISPHLDEQKGAFKVLPVEVVYGLSVHPPAMKCCSLLFACAWMDAHKHCAFGPVLCVGTGTWLCTCEYSCACPHVATAKSREGSLVNLAWLWVQMWGGRLRQQLVVGLGRPPPGINGASEEEFGNKRKQLKACVKTKGRW